MSYHNPDIAIIDPVTDSFVSEFQKLTLEVIASTAFGLKTETIEEGDSIFLQKVRWLFSVGNKKMPLHRRLLLFFMCMLI